MNIGGYLMLGHSQAPASFNAGYSLYTAAWPLVENIRGTVPKRALRHVDVRSV